MTFQTNYVIPNKSKFCKVVKHDWTISKVKITARQTKLCHMEQKASQVGQVLQVVKPDVLYLLVFS